MANFITKKDGTKEPFNVEKIKKGVIAASTNDGLSGDEALKLSDRVSSTVASAFMGVDEVSGAKVREKILEELDSSSPSVADSWRNYERTK